MVTGSTVRADRKALLLGNALARWRGTADTAVAQGLLLIARASVLAHATQPLGSAAEAGSTSRGAMGSSRGNRALSPVGQQGGEVEGAHDAVAV